MCVYIQRTRLLDFQRFVATYAVIFKIHPELVLQQAANMPDGSAITREAERIVGDADVETAWFICVCMCGYVYIYLSIYLDR